MCIIYAVLLLESVVSAVMVWGCPRSSLHQHAPAPVTSLMTPGHHMDVCPTSPRTALRVHRRQRGSHSEASSGAALPELTRISEIHRSSVLPGLVKISSPDSLTIPAGAPHRPHRLSVTFFFHATVPVQMDNAGVASGTGDEGGRTKRLRSAARSVQDTPQIIRGSDGRTRNTGAHTHAMRRCLTFECVNIHSSLCEASCEDTSTRSCDYPPAPLPLKWHTLSYGYTRIGRSIPRNVLELA
jgi:hypothetical protein